MGGLQNEELEEAFEEEEDNIDDTYVPEDAAEAESDLRSVFARNLSPETTKHDLEAPFAGIGGVRAEIPSRDGNLRGFGFIHFPDAETAAAAVDEFQNFQVCGRPLQLKLSTSKETSAKKRRTH